MLFRSEEAMRHQEGFHLHLPPFHYVSQLVMHLWEETLEGIFVVDYLEQWWGILMRRPQEEKGRNFSLPMKLLKDKKHFGGGDCNVPKF